MFFLINCETIRRFSLGMNSAKILSEKDKKKQREYIFITFSLIQFNLIQFNSIQFNSVQFNLVQFISAPISLVQFSSILISSVQFSSAVLCRREQAINHQIK